LELASQSPGSLANYARPAGGRLCAGELSSGAKGAFRIAFPQGRTRTQSLQFAFLIGSWRCEAKVRSANGEWQRFEATWLGRFILDG